MHNKVGERNLFLNSKIGIPYNIFGAYSFFKKNFYYPDILPHICHLFTCGPQGRLNGWNKNNVVCPALSVLLKEPCQLGHYTSLAQTSVIPTLSVCRLPECHQSDRRNICVCYSKQPSDKDDHMRRSNVDVSPQTV